MFLRVLFLHSFTICQASDMLISADCVPGAQSGLEVLAIFEKMWSVSQKICNATITVVKGDALFIFLLRCLGNKREASSQLRPISWVNHWLIYPLKTMLDCNKNWYTFLVVLLALFGCITTAPGNCKYSCRTLYH